MMFKDLPAPLIPTSQHFDSLKLWNDDRAGFILLLNYSYTAGYDKFNPAFYSVFVGAGRELPTENFCKINQWSET
jgi:hypothetical protein